MRRFEDQANASNRTWLDPRWIWRNPQRHLSKRHSYATGQCCRRSCAIHAISVNRLLRLHTPTLSCGGLSSLHRRHRPPSIPIADATPSHAWPRSRRSPQRQLSPQPRPSSAAITASPKIPDRIPCSAETCLSNHTHEDQKARPAQRPQRSSSALTNQRAQSTGMPRPRIAAPARVGERSPG
jgi:hypothetical protein